MKGFNLKFKHIAVCVLASVGLYSCTEQVDTSARYVFKESTCLSYLQKYPENYSSYLDLISRVPISPLSESTVAQLLSARGHYTVFAPTNEAIQEYLDTLSKTEDYLTAPSWNAFTDSVKLDSIRKVIVYNSVIDSGDEDQPYETGDFPMQTGEEFALANLNDRKLAVKYTDDPDSIYINGDCPINIRNRDIYAINGVIHMIEKVIAPKDITAAVYLQDILDKQTETYLVMARVIQACGLLDTLNAIRDEKYEALYQRGLIEDLHGMTSYGFAEGSVGYAPKHRKYGFTIFAETDDFWQSQGIDPKGPDMLAKLVQWIQDEHQYSEEDVFTTDEDYENPKNLLYQWVTYHILPMKLGTNKLVIHNNEYGYNLTNPNALGIPVEEFYASFGKRRLFKLYESKESNGVYINRFPIKDNGRKGTNHEIGCDPDKVGCRVGKDDERMVVNDIINCNIYPIDAPLSYNDNVRNNLGKQRIRFDGMSLFPEAANNDIRKKAAEEERYQHVYIPKTSVYPYFKDFIINDDANFVYYNAYKYDWCNLHADEMKAVGRYEFMFTLPPVPRTGTYEFRYEVLANGNRGIAQVYFGTDPDNLPVAGIPLDITMRSDDPRTGWENDGPDQDYNAEVDKRMRNNGFMKGSQAINSNDGTERGYNDRENVRRIMWRGTMYADKTYYLKMKSVLDSDRKEFYMDYMEYCPKEVYDNPNEPEDIW